jgi:hypothetical protein
VPKQDLTRPEALGCRICQKFCLLGLGWSRSHGENLDGCDRDLARIGNGRMQQMRDSRPAAENVQDWNKRNVKFRNRGAAFTRLLGRFCEKALNFRDGAVLVEVVMPTIGKAYEMLGLVGERE